MRDSSKRWRLLDTGASDGATNMAMDMATQRLRKQGAVPPTIHIYDWVPPAVSIGRMQRTETSVDLEACSADGIGVVRRPTGGRAVLHESDFTFSIIASAGDDVPQSVRGSYRVMAAIIARAMADLGLSAQVGPSVRGVSSSEACFSCSTEADLTVDGAKIVGGAQRWDGDVLLQQNSILCVADHERALRYIRPATGQTVGEACRELRAKTCSLQEVIGRRPSRSEIAGGLCRAFEDALGVSIQPGEATSEEVTVARSCLDEVRI